MVPGTLARVIHHAIGLYDAPEQVPTGALHCDDLVMVLQSPPIRMRKGPIEWVLVLSPKGNAKWVGYDYLEPL